MRPLSTAAWLLLGVASPALAAAQTDPVPAQTPPQGEPGDSGPPEAVEEETEGAEILPDRVNSGLRDIVYSKLLIDFDIAGQVVSTLKLAIVTSGICGVECGDAC